MKCTKVKGSMVRIDAGNGQVFGVNADANLFTLNSLIWTQLLGEFLHVTVGAAGVWAVTASHRPSKMVGGDWAKTKGENVMQLDAGGDGFLVAVSGNNDVYCLRQNETVNVKNNTFLPWTEMKGKLKYYSCGPLGCWGVNATESIFHRPAPKRNPCKSGKPRFVDGKFSMVEVGSDGSVYGVNSLGELYRSGGVFCTSTETDAGGRDLWVINLYIKVGFFLCGLGLSQVWTFTQQ
ncbi:fish-egg lectin-like [Lissotriton helveticus]